MKRNDVLLILALLTVAVAGLIITRAGAGAGGVARVYLRGEPVWACPLDADGAFSVEGVDIEVSDGRARVASADCPDSSCVRAGGLSRAGEAAICLPNAVSLIIEGEGGLDAVIR